MDLNDFFKTAAYQEEKSHELMVCNLVIERFADERPLAGVPVVVGHLIVMNAMVIIEALWRAGAEITLCSTHACATTEALSAELAGYGLPVLPVEEAVTQGDIYLDVAGTLGRVRLPQAGVEVTRSGDHVYRNAACPIISIDKSHIKLFEDFLGTGEAFVRAWQKFRPHDSLENKRSVQFGYGKVGRGIAHHNRMVGIDTVVVEPSKQARQRAQEDGFVALEPGQVAELERVLGQANLVFGVTGMEGAICRTVPVDWLRANQPLLVSVGHDEFGPDVADEEHLGYNRNPINFHLVRPTQNRFMDTTLAAQALALAEIVNHRERYAPGINPLPSEIDDWLLQTWRSFWPQIDLSAIASDLGL